MRAVVCLPTRNERDSIEAMVKSIRKIKLDVFVSDEHSTDGTLAIAKKLKVPVYQRACSGKGCGVQTAIAVAAKKKYDLLIFIDCDCTYPVDAIPRMINVLEQGNYDMVVGARNFKNVPFVNRIGNFAHIWGINLLYLTHLKDINSGLRVMRVSKFKGLIDAKAFDVEAQITVRALKNGMKIKEMPIAYNKRMGESKLRLSDGVSILWRIIIERFTS